MPNRPALLVLVLAALTAPLAAQVKLEIPAACTHLPAPSPEQRVSIDTVHKILASAVPKDALDLDHLRKNAQKDVDQHPNDPFFLGLLGNLQFRAGDLEASTASLNRSMQIFPCIDYVQFTAAKYYALIGNSAAAQQHLDFAYALDPGNPDISSEWTQTHIKAGAAVRKVSNTQLQKRPPLSATPTAMPFGGLPDRPLLAPVTREVVITMEKSGPSISTAPGFHGPSQYIQPDNMPTVTLTLNGQPVRLLLNLGSEELTITRGAAEHIGVSPTNNHSGTADLSIAGLDLPNTPLTVTDNPESSFSKNSFFTDGSVGLYFFSRSLIKLDVWGDKLTLSPLPAQSPAVTATDHDKRWTSLYVVPSTHQLLVTAEIGSRFPQLFLLDLSNDISIIAPDTSNRAEDAHEFVNAAGHSSTNTIRIYIGGKTVEVPSPGITTEPRFPILGMGISGRLGRNAIRGVDLTFDYRDHLMKIN